MVVVVFRSRIRKENAAEFHQLADSMLQLAQAMPGFISYKAYTSEDGERVSIHEWESPEHLLAWREHPEHAAAQRLGREKFYEEYTSYVCEPYRDSRFKRQR
jgi:heme-degrading monooxygenase HmoA